MSNATYQEMGLICNKEIYTAAAAHNPVSLADMLSNGVKATACGFFLSPVVWATPALATFEGKNGAIAYECGEHICKVNSDKSNRQQLTRAPNVIDNQPVWSADGTQLAFTRHHITRGGVAVYVLTLKTRAVRKLAEGHSPSWSPGSTKLAYIRQARIHVMSSNGKVLRSNLGGELASYPAWSPDGRRLAYVKGVSVASGGCPDFLVRGMSAQAASPTCPAQAGELWVMDPAGQNRRKLLEATADAGFFQVQWSPDSARLIFSRGRIITMLGMANGRIQVLFGGYAPSVSPDYKRVAFSGRVRTSSGNRLRDAIMTSATDGSQRRVLAFGIRPAWQAR